MGDGSDGHFLRHAFCGPAPLSLSHILLVPQMASGTTDDIPRREMGFSPHLPRRLTIFGPPMDKNNAVRKLDHSDQ